MSGLVDAEPVDDVPFDAALVNMIRGKSLMMPEDTGREIRALCRMIDWFESKLDEHADPDDIFGTNGWREYFGAAE